jgi:hypothetical protein
MFAITKLIPAAKGLEMLRSGIQSIVKEPVDIFHLIYIESKGEIIFKVFTPSKVIQEPYTGKNKDLILFMVRNLAKLHLKKGETLDIVKMERNADGTINLDVFVTLNNEKIKHEIKNYKP